MTEPLDEKAEHPRIWLEPAGAPDRCWCSDNQWGDEGVEYVLAASPSPSMEMEVVACDGDGWVFWNPDSGEEYYTDHPVHSGVCEDAERIRRSTPQEDVLYRGMQEWFEKSSAAEARIKALEEALREIRDGRDKDGMKSDFPAEIARSALKDNAL